MRYAFVIDQSRCIGCHACSLACKAEHDVPIGSYRTWVKYVEKGAFPDVRRFFSVLRCNHCDDAPCMTICPVTALFRRENGIVDFDREACIGCKACMQACPYDALYIHPDHGTAEKCNFCAHRVENEMEPPCATVCPTESIVVGDMDDPASRVSHLISSRQVSVRKPEKGTRPKVFYIEGEPAALTPGMADPSGGYLWADRRGVEKTNYITSRFDPNNGLMTSTESAQKDLNGSPTRHKEPAKNNDPGNIPSASGTPPDGWLSSELPPAAAAQALATAAIQGEADFYTGAWEGLAPTRTVYDVYHEEAVWGWRVSAYLWTKSLAAGALLIATLAPWIGTNEESITLAAPLVGLFFLAITGVLLVADLKRPSRFWTILTRPNWDSWASSGRLHHCSLRRPGDDVERHGVSCPHGLRAQSLNIALNPLATCRSSTGNCRLQWLPLRPSQGSGFLAKSAFILPSFGTSSCRRRRYRCASVVPLIQPRRQTTPLFRSDSNGSSSVDRF